MRDICLHAGLFVMLWLFFFLVSPAPVSAEVKFYEAYRQGLEAEKAQNWKEAREHFALAARLNPVARRLVRIPGRVPIRHYDPYVHLAHCEARLGMLVQAAANLQKSREAGVTPELILQEIQQHLEKGAQEARNRAEARKRLLTQSSTEQGVLLIDSAPGGAIVFINGIESGETPVELTLPAGAHSVKWVLTGYQPSEEKIEVEKGKSRTVSALLAKIPVKQPQSRPAAAVAGSAKDASPLQMQQTPATVDDESESAATPLTQTAELQADQVAIVADTPVRPLSIQAPAPTLPPYLLAGLVVIAGAVGAAVFYRKKRARNSRRPPEYDRDNTPTEFVDDVAVAFAPSPSIANVAELAAVAAFAKPLPETANISIHGYRLAGILGMGGMGTTYLGVRLRDELPVALKVPHEHLLQNDEFVARFLREASLGTALHHPNIIRIYESGRSGGRPYIAMEVLRGETLEKRLQENGRIPVRAALEIAREIALALDYARLKGIVHRDLKPENVMLLEAGGVKVMDFGIARVLDSPGLTASQMYLGTPAYSAPEAFGTGDVDQQSDLYSLGIILYRMIRGELPFQGKSTLELLQMHCNKPLPDFPSDLQVPSQVGELVEFLSAKKKEHRYSSAEKFLVHLNAYLNHSKT